MIKKLHNKYSELCSQDEELNNLFLNAIECSKLFYIRTLTLVKGSRTNGEEFEFSFEQTAQPLGRRLINLMINIKLRIRIARFKRKAKSNNEISKIFRVLYRVTEQINCFINNIIYKASLTQSTHHKLTKQLYYVTIAISILSLILTNSVFHQDLSRPAIITANTLLCILLGTAALIMRPGGDFGKVDISGKNIVAYKYRVFFNNISNKKIHNIFTMQHAYEPGHKLSQDIESSECETIT